MEARADADATLILDAGDLVLPPPNRTPGLVAPDAGEVERRARLLAQAFARIGTTAFTPGERDLAIGPALLRRILDGAKVPVVSANLFDRRGQRLFAPDRMVDAAGVKIGIFGLTRALPDDADLWKGWGIEARDPAQAARTEIAALRGRGAQVIVALLHVGSTPDIRRLLTEAPGIDWAVAGHAGLSLDTPDEVGKSRVLEAMTQGKQLGRLDLHVRGDSLAFADRGQRAQLETIAADHRRQLDDYRKRVADAKPAAMRDYYTTRIADLDKSLARETALLAMLPGEIKGSWFENRIMPLDASVPDQTGVALLVAGYNRENARRAAAGKPVGVAARDPHVAAPHPPPAGSAALSPPVPATAPLTYAGSIACGSCHKAALKLWQTTKHARALESLAKTHRDRDPTCIGCHVTGYLRPGGTTDLAVATARLREVGCEACHGPGLVHLTAADHGAIARAVPASICLGCHTPDQTNGDFDYPTFLKAVVGPGHGG